MYDIFHTFLPVLQRFPFLGPFFILRNGLFEYNVPPPANYKLVAVITPMPMTTIGMSMYKYILVGGFNPSEKYESQLFLIWKNTSHVPNHQPVYISI